jgi:TetR/AcrR family transcriptional regulator, mexJK operon transcriptional repressor
MSKSPIKRSAVTRANALLEAERLYNMGGYEAINLQTISETVGVTKAALFYHFENKQDLFSQLLEAMLLRYNQMIRASFDTHLTSEAQFLALSLQLSKQPMFDAYRYLRSEQQHLSAEQQVALQHTCNELLFLPIKQGFSAGAERGEVQAHDPSMVTSLFLSFCVLASQLRNMEKGALSKTGLKKMFAVFWHGLAQVH